MNKQVKFRDCQFQVKEADESEGKGIIQGFASVFKNLDYDREIIDQGAFKKTLNDNHGIVPILDSHDPREPIGWNLEATETTKGLKVKGELDIKNNPRALSKYSFIRKALEVGAKAGLSIGFEPVRWEVDSEDKENTILHWTEVKLLEYSIVTFPANPLANVTGAKSRKDIYKDNFLEEIKTVLAVTEELVSSGHEFKESEVKILSELSNQLRTLAEPSLDYTDTLEAVKELTERFKKAAA